MEFHPSKRQTLHITRLRKPLLSTYNLYGQQSEAANSAKYLGDNFISRPTLGGGGLTWKWAGVYRPSEKFGPIRKPKL